MLMITCALTKEIPKLQPFSFPPIVHINSRTSAICSVEKGEIPLSFRWLKDGKNVDAYKNIEIESHSKFSVIVIDPVDTTNSGNYTCIASNSAGSDSLSVLLHVEAPPVWRKEPSDLETSIGDEINLNCEAYGSPEPHIIWRKISDKTTEKLNDEIKIKNGSLHIKSITEEDAGMYQCEASNNVGSSLKKTIALIVRGTTLKIQPFYFPPNLSAGQSAKILCTVIQGSDPVNFEWSKDGQEITSSNNIEITTLKDISILIINSIGVKDSGNYTCTATNNFGSINHTSLLAVDAPPRWISEPQDVDVRVGKPVQIECSASGFPLPKISWKRFTEDGQVMEPLALQSENVSLKLSSAGLKDEGSYICRAENGIGGLQKIIRISILGKTRRFILT
ncbi:Down syndrome cell adhesion molecule-like protein Dscam2 [Centruroides sculpturatus]|uniref:Down syndrome cell adhesion molecule-like protein Dscam2 n=1 Tax=Centruroides sculpturatus TaxID=218467 RepID=UPI000C6DC188|nr:Down syndrome cell adhesion molecule-like protein Dscam2 [Centruroides sculpturatus]